MGKTLKEISKSLDKTGGDMMKWGARVTLLIWGGLIMILGFIFLLAIILALI
mgnify:CR=1 FL=1